MFLSPLYRVSPVFIQNLLISLRGLARRLLRDGYKTRAYMREVEKNERDEKTLLAYANSELKEALRNAIEKSPFYHNVEKDELECFPFIDKSIVQENHRLFVSKNKQKIVVSGTTSGTSGSPLTVPQQMTSIIREQAFVNRLLKWAGYEEGDKRAWIRGDLIVPLEQEKPPFWRYSYFEGIVYFSTFHLSSYSMPLYINCMHEFGVNIIQAYPSSITMLANFLKNNNLKYPGKLKSIITSSEELSMSDRTLVEEVFECPVFDWYGLFERVAAISNCEYGSYHLLNDYSHVELDPMGDGKYEIIGTNFNNHYFPLIRYKTGDHIILEDANVSCPCGRVYPIVKKILGREVDYIYNFNGEKVYALDQCVKGVNGVLGSQFEQYYPKEVCVNIIVNGDFDSQQEEKFGKNIKARLGENMKISFNRTSRLKRNLSGKYIQSICHL